MSTHDIEIFKNTLKDNETSNVSLLSYLTTGNPLKDPKYDPFVESISIHDNVISGGGHKPAGRAAELAPMLRNPHAGAVHHLRRRDAAERLRMPKSASGTMVMRPSSTMTRRMSSRIRSTIWRRTPVSCRLSRRSKSTVTHSKARAVQCTG